MGNLRRATILGATAVLCLLVFPARAGEIHTIKVTEGPAPGATDDKWSESYLHAYRGDKVVWKNPARRDGPHNVTAYSRNWSKSVTLYPGDITSKTFRETGTYKYRCTIHSSFDSNGACQGMCGVVHVMQ